MYSMTLVPILLFVGAFIFWYFTRRTAALVMALGFLPTFFSLAHFWIGPAPYMENEKGGVVPDGKYLEMAEMIGSLASTGNVISGVSFIVLAWGMREYAKSAT